MLILGDWSFGLAAGVPAALGAWTVILGLSDSWRRSQLVLLEIWWESSSLKCDDEDLKLLLDEFLRGTALSRLPM